MSNETTLLPCPFCGGEAEVRRLDLDAIDDGLQVYGVWCVDDLHAVEHGGWQHGHYIDNYATKAEAIAAWNVRAERTCRIVMDGPLGKCSACGDECFGDAHAARYCPSCGAKVVSE